MYYEILTNLGKPTLVCVPGLLGGPEDFRGIVQEIHLRFQIIFVNPNQERRERGLFQLSREETEAVSFDSSAEEIKDLLIKHEIEKAYFCGVSLGGKIVYDFAIRYPELFSGAVITDVAPSSFLDSSLYQMVSQIVENADLTLPWEELKKSFHRLIPERNLRSLIQSQVFYPHQSPPGIWKTGMQGLEALLQQNSIDDQTECFVKANQELLSRKVKISVLSASHLSGITPEGRAKIITDWASIQMTEIPNSSHFLHITHAPEVKTLVLQMLEF